MQTKFTVKEIADKLQISKDSINKRKQRESWQPCGERIEKGQKTPEYSLFAISQDLREKLLTKLSVAGAEAYTGKSAQPAGKTHSTLKGVAAASKPPAAAPKKPKFMVDEPTTELIKADSAPPVLAASGKDIVEAPERAKRIALAKYELVKLLLGYREAHPLMKKGDCDSKFIAAYNSAAVYTTIYGIIGEVSMQTIYGWMRKLKENKNDYTALIPGWFNPAGRPKIPEEILKIIEPLVLNANKMSIGTAYRLTKYECQSKGVELDVSEATIRRYFDWYQRWHYDTWILKREGEKALKDKVASYITRDPSLLEVGECLVADGHRLSFEVINPFTGKPCRAMLVAYIDWKSYALCGYEIMLEENTQCIASALRNSIIHLGKVPKAAYQDNGKAFRSKFFNQTADFRECGFTGLFNRLGIKAVYAEAYNARAKIIERWFLEFQETFERLLPSFTGANINDKPAWRMRNEKFHKANRIDFTPTIEQAIKYIEKWRAFHYAQPCPHVEGHTIGEVYDAGRGPGVDAARLDDLMMVEKTATIYRNGIRFLGEYYYDEILYGYKGDAIIKYSLFDLSYIKVYLTDGRFLCLAKRIEKVHPLAAISGTVQDVETLKESIKRQKRQLKDTRKHAAAEVETFRKAGSDIEWSKQIAAEEKRVVAVTEKAHTDEIVLPPETPEDPPLFTSYSEKEEWEYEQRLKRKVS